MPTVLVLDVPIAPQAALLRLAAAINQRPKRAFGVIKTQSEFVGVIADDRFEVWERRQRALHAVGRARARRGGARIEVTFPLTPRARALLVVFFVCYAVVSAGIVSLPSDAANASTEVLVAAAGAGVLALSFYLAARRQRRDLTAFLTAAFTAGAPEAR